MTLSVPTPTTARGTKIARRWLVAGQVLCREGDPPGSAYVICEGRVRVYRRDPSAPDRNIELAQLGTGDVIGELAPLLDQPRNATVQAIEPTQVLEISLSQLAGLLNSQAALQRVVGAALVDRSGLEPHQLASVASRLGVPIPALPEGPSLHARRVPPPTYDASLVYPKQVTCPACGSQFSALVPQPRKAMPGERSTDFHQLYRTPFNPSDYELWVCPTDLYVAFPSDFADLRPAHVEPLAAVVEDVVAGWGGERPDFNVERNLELREKSLQLAQAIYTLRQAPVVRHAALFHRLAWCARERGDLEQESAWLAQALEAYTSAYNESDLGGAKEELRILYLCGELNVRLGNVEAGLSWLSQGMRHEKLHQHPSWERMLRERYTAVRESPGVA